MVDLAIPNFRLVKLIGAGGFGEVWLAVSVTGKSRAVKIVRRNRFEEPQIAADELEAFFEREFSGVRRFEDLAANHPALITIQHVGRSESGAFYYYVMPLADDATPDPEYTALNLERKIERDGPLDWPAAVALIRRLASGLEILHRNGLCHGDVSSANVLFVDGQPVLGDPGMTGIDGKVLIARSPGFNDPHAQRILNHSGDLFALGRVFYHALAGLHPAESYPLLPLERMKELPVAKLADILDRCGDPNPADRFQDVEEMIHRLDAELAETGESTPGTGQSPPSRRGLLLPALAAATLILLTLGAWLMLAGRSPPVPDLVKIEGTRVTAYTANPLRALWSVEVGDVIAVNLADLDDDGTPEIVCTVRHQSRANRDGGRIVVLNADGSPRWHFDTTLDECNYFPPGQRALACHGFLLCDWDPGKPGLEMVVVAQNASGWFPTALHFLDSGGKRLATWWHPGHIHPENLRFVRETPDSPYFLTITGYNNRYGVMFQDLPAGKHFHRSIFALLDPRVPGDHAAPPGRGTLKGRDGMTLWYRLIDPQWAACQPLRARDFDGSGRKDLKIWTYFGNREQFPDERINQFDYYRFDGTHLATHLGDGHQTDALHLRPDELTPTPKRTD